MRVLTLKKKIIPFVIAFRLFSYLLAPFGSLEYILALSLSLVRFDLDLGWEASQSSRLRLCVKSALSIDKQPVNISIRIELSSALGKKGYGIRYVQI